MFGTLWIPKFDLGLCWMVLLITPLTTTLAQNVVSGKDNVTVRSISNHISGELASEHGRSYGIREHRRCRDEEVIYTDLVAINGSSSFSFLAVGDAGGIPTAPYTSSIGRAVSRDIRAWSETNKPTFALLLGDNFYERGVKNVADPRFKLTFENAYDTPSLMIPWYVVAGNHDHLGNLTAQILYEKRSKRWKYPCAFYTKIYKLNAPSKIGSNDSTADKSTNKLITFQIVVIDTCIMCDKYPMLNALEKSKYLNSRSRNLQWRWLNRILSSSKADFLIVVGHYPIYSVGQHGPQAHLIKKLKPLLHKHKVSAYVSGHDHNLQHLKDHSGMDYVIMGSGSKLSVSDLNKRFVPKGMLKFMYHKSGGYGVASITKDHKLQFVLRNSAGDDLYKTRIDSRIN